MLLNKIRIFKTTYDDLKGIKLNQYQINSHMVKNIGTQCVQLGGMANVTNYIYTKSSPTKLQTLQVIFLDIQYTK